MLLVSHLKLPAIPQPGSPEPREAGSGEVGEAAPSRAPSRAPRRAAAFHQLPLHLPAAGELPQPLGWGQRVRAGREGGNLPLGWKQMLVRGPWAWTLQGRCDKGCPQPHPLCPTPGEFSLLQRLEVLGSASRLSPAPHSEHLRRAGVVLRAGQAQVGKADTLKGPEQEAGVHAVKRDDQPGPAGRQAIPGRLSPAWPQLT